MKCFLFWHCKVFSNEITQNIFIFSPGQDIERVAALLPEEVEIYIE